MGIDTDGDKYGMVKIISLDSMEYLLWPLNVFSRGWVRKGERERSLSVAGSVYLALNPPAGTRVRPRDDGNWLLA